MEIMSTRGLNFTLFDSTKQASKEDVLLQQMRQTGRLSVKDTVMFGSAKPRLPLASDSDESILAANAKRGEAHARRLAKTTPVVPLGDMQGRTVKIELRKVKIPNHPDGNYGVGLFIDGKPWVFQPSLENASFSTAYFSSHDVHRHLLLRRDRTVNLTHVAGEYLTGMAGNNTPPRLERMWDGLIANFADEAMSKSPFRILATLISDLPTRRFPLGTSLQLDYYIPPADISYRETGRKKNVHLGLIGEPIETPPLRKLYENPEQLFQRVSRHPDAQIERIKEKDGHWVRIIKLPSAGPGLIPVWMFTEKGKADTQDLTKLFEHTVQHYWLTPDGQKLDAGQAQRRLLRLEGQRPTARIGNLAYYLQTDPKTGQIRIYEVHPERIQSVTVNGNTFKELEPVYTGQPYRPVTLERIELVGPDGKPIDNLEDLPSRIPKGIEAYKKAFPEYQNKIKELLEQGHIPMDSKLEVWDEKAQNTVKMSLPDYYRAEMKAGRLPKNTPMTMQGIFNALTRSEALFPNALFPDEDLDIAPFPPPPYGGRHFESAK